MILVVTTLTAVGVYFTICVLILGIWLSLSTPGKWSLQPWLLIPVLVILIVLQLLANENETLASPRIWLRLIAAAFIAGFYIDAHYKVMKFVAMSPEELEKLRNEFLEKLKGKSG